jgi:hypothetical protein
VKILAVVSALALTAVQAIAEPHLGFDVDDSGGRLRVSHVYAMTPGAKAGAKLGDILVSVGGTSAKTEGDFKALVSKRKPGDIVRVRIKRGAEVSNIAVQVVDGDAMRAAIEEAKKLSNERKENELRRVMAERQKLEDEIADRGAVRITAGSVQDDIIGNPQIILEVENISEQWIDAVELKVEMFDKFGRPAKGILGASHEQTFLVQEVIGGLGTKRVVASVPWHDTVGKSRVSVVKYALDNGSVITPPNPDTVMVKK